MTVISKLRALLRPLVGVTTRINQPLLFVGALLFLVFLTSLLTVLIADDRGVDMRYSQSLVGARQVFDNRDFSKTPFGYMDAYDACELEARASLGTRMIRSTILPLSTRYEIKNNTYFVVLDVDVGDEQEWTGATIYCDIDPVAEKISYYKEVHNGELSLLSRTMSVFGEILD